MTYNLWRNTLLRLSSCNQKRDRDQSDGFEVLQSYFGRNHDESEA